MNRKQKAMEERYRKHSTPEFRYKPKAIDTRDEVTMEFVEARIKHARKWYGTKEEADSEVRSQLSHGYKNGAELFDRAIAIENSPLGRALS